MKNCYLVSMKYWLLRAKSISCCEQNIYNLFTLSSYFHATKSLGYDDLSLLEDTAA